MAEKTQRLLTIPTGDIPVGARHRRDLGDLRPLAESIRTEGLLQPIGVTPENKLVFGMRRLLAARDILGWGQIEARVVNVSSIAAGEYAENELRKDFTLSERDAIRRTLERQIGDRRIAPQTVVEVGNSPQTLPSEGKTRDITAQRAGFQSTDEARAVRQVTEKGTPELVQAMDRGELPVSVAARVAELPKADLPPGVFSALRARRGPSARLWPPALFRLSRFTSRAGAYPAAHFSTHRCGCAVRARQGPSWSYSSPQRPGRASAAARFSFSETLNTDRRTTNESGDEKDVDQLQVAL